MKKVCPNCGREGLEGSDFCGECGTRLVEKVVKEQAPSPKQQPDVTRDVSKRVRAVDTDEQLRYSLKNGYISNVLFSDNLSREDVLITDKRLYFNHTLFNFLSKKRIEARVDLEDISCSTIEHNNPWNWFVLALLSFITLVVMIVLFMSDIVRFDDATNGATMAIIPFALTIVFIFVWYYKKNTFLTIEYGSGCGKGMDTTGIIRIPVRIYDLERVREFQRALYLAKDELRISRYGR